MKSLRQYIDEADSDVRLFQEIKIGIPGIVAQHPVIITAILERTAVVHPPDHVEGKFLVNLKGVFVEEENVVWVNKSIYERQKIMGAARGRDNANIAKGYG